MAIFKQRQGKPTSSVGSGRRFANGAKGARNGKGGGFGGGSRVVHSAPVARHVRGGPGAKGGKGGKAGKGAGSWVFVPAAAPAPPMRGSVRRFGNVQGHAVRSAPFRGHGGKGHGGKGIVRKGAVVKAHGGKGGAGGKGKPVNKRMDKLGKLDADVKVWVGGLPTDASWKKLSQHFEDGFLKPSIVEIMSKGSACLAFKSAEEATSAIGALNGSEFDGQSIEVDVWTKKEKKERPDKAKKSKTVVRMKLKGKKGKEGKKATESPMAAKIKAVDHSLKVWVGGLSTETKWKAVKQHFEDNGCVVDLCDLLRKPGSACVTFKTDDEASTAVDLLNGTDLDGETITVDVWSRPERKEKKAKED
jgi:RNA recognition motif-containing protein